MKIALIGYGKMGQAIERIALHRGHEVCLKITSKNPEDFIPEKLTQADVVIEFTRPDAALDNVSKCFAAGLPVVCGTTGWNETIATANELCKQHDAAFLQASNFSIGVNVFFEINSILASMMNHYPQYEVSIEEVHHVHKKDAPSGTAITIAERILDHLARKKTWTLAQPFAQEDLSITAHRLDEYPGTHTVKYSSAIDDIELTHRAHNREGFAEGAVVAAEFLCGKKGLFTMKDVLGL